MSAPAPHFLLFSEARPCPVAAGNSAGKWQFVLESVDGGERVVACDEETEASGERLNLLAVVRGLEALDQPSRVTLLTPSRYVAHGLRHALDDWRENHWLWERFGERTPIKNGDLWRRIDHAMRYHEVECRTWRCDAAHTPSTLKAPRTRNWSPANAERGSEDIESSPLVNNRSQTRQPSLLRRILRAAWLPLVGLGALIRRVFFIGGGIRVNKS